MEDPEDLLKNAEQSAYDIIELLVQKGGEMLYDNYITENSVQFAVTSTLNIIGSTVELFFIRHNTKENSAWVEEPEPAACSIDTWARNAIPVKKKLKMPSAEQNNSIVPADMKSVASHSSRRSGLTRGLRPAQSIRNPKINNAIEETVLPVAIPQEKVLVSEEEEMLRSRKEREMKRKKEEGERMKKMKDEEAEKEKKMQKEAEDMKNKAFTYDHKGKILFVNPVKYESIPPAYIAVRYVSEEPVREVPKQTRNTASRGFASVKRTKTAPQQEKEWVKNITSIQPPLIEAIKLNANVTFIDGARVKYPQNIVEDSKTMTRKQYNTLYQPKLEASAVSNMPDKKSSTVSSVDSLKKSPDSKNDLFDIIPDYEDFNAGSQKGNRATQSISPLRAQHGKIIHYGTGFQLDELAGPSQKFNAEILKNKNWGMNPPLKEPKHIERLPKRPDSKELRELYGDIVKKPKDHPFITPQELWQSKGLNIKRPRDRPNIERIEKKTRMPPPPYGFTMVNALPEIAGLGGSLESGKSLNRSEIMK